MTAYRRRFYRITASALVGAVGITGISATASSASSATHGTTSSSVAPAAATSAEPGYVLVGASIRPAPVAPGAANASSNATTYGVVGVVIKALKAIPSVWNAAVKKVKAGYQAFKSWWENSVPQWIKNLLTGVTIYDIYNEIRNELGL